MTSAQKVEVVEERCRHCGFCETVSTCKSPDARVGCLARFWACPNEARRLVEEECAETVTITVNGVEFEVPRRVTVKRALELSSLTIGYLPGEGDVSAPCSLGCYSCLVEASLLNLAGASSLAADTV